MIVATLQRFLLWKAWYPLVSLSILLHFGRCQVRKSLFDLLISKLLNFFCTCHIADSVVIEVLNDYDIDHSHTSNDVERLEILGMHIGVKPKTQWAREYGAIALWWSKWFASVLMIFHEATGALPAGRAIETDTVEKRTDRELQTLSLGCGHCSPCYQHFFLHSLCSVIILSFIGTRNLKGNPAHVPHFNLRTSAITKHGL